ncbi:hypothetical protein IW139_002458 [Coemansia sp. RSA 353]|nr:hypothetical protein EV181_001608 [Coemansia sp. RSA 532]KAJ2272312.1 hypothetical protein J3F81_003107 [Coemansia sp. RSA 371]KAJ2282202.1 hypothetical protein GGH14_001737 [Coemansia sp. RSA 370]KAJ2287618.1 hypothetical protein IW141_004784 [Coemansia sp. RSA 355]KAJ2298112.1 hypothetical protein IW139_002458 [Coemansia sp. RSA 353]
MGSPDSYDIHALEVSPQLVLDTCKERVSCGFCGKSVKFFCYYCYKPVAGLEGRLPQIRLPFKLDVVKHPNELDGKSTAVHAKIVAPQDVDIITFTDTCLDGVDVQTTALLFPGPDAQDVAEMDMTSIERVVVIDGTWSQAKAMMRNCSQLQRMQKVTIKPRRTRFWRFQNVDDQYLATIEAIYFLYRDSVGSNYNGEYDALMYFYKYFYEHIQSEYASQPERCFNHRHQKNYIEYDSAAPNPNVRLAKPDTVAKVNYDFDDLELGNMFGSADPE